MNLESPEVTQLVTLAQDTKAMAEAYVIDSNDMYEMAGNELKEIKARAKRVEDQRKIMTQPLDTTKKAIMDFFRAPLEMLTNAENTLKRGMLTYKQEIDRKEAAERARIIAEAERQAAEAKAKNPDKPAPPVILPPSTVKPVAKVSGISTRKVWKAEIQDEALVPDEYWVIDTQKIDAVARSTKGGLQIPGVRIYEEEVMAAGRR